MTDSASDTARRQTGDDGEESESAEGMLADDSGAPRQFRQIFEAITGTTELVTEQETDTGSRCLDDDHQDSEHVADGTDYDGLSDALDGADGDGEQY